MMKQVFIFLFIPFIVKSQNTTLVKSVISNTDYDTIAFYAKRVTFIGNSITFGTASSDTFHRWTNVFTLSKGAVQTNMGISGQTMQGKIGCTSTIFDMTTIPAYVAGTDAALFISLGINDVGFNNGYCLPASFQTQYNVVIQYAINTKGWVSERIVLLTPYWIDSTGYASYVGTCDVTVASDVVRHEDYVNRVIDIANDNGCQVVDVYSAMRDSPLNGTFLSGDGLHPNDTGHAFIANVVLAHNFYY